MIGMRSTKLRRDGTVYSIVIRRRGRAQYPFARREAYAMSGAAVAVEITNINATVG
jgi:hypothetical protein